MRMKRTKKQAQERNGLKYRLLGVQANLKQMLKKKMLCKEEREEIKNALDFISCTLYTWEEGNEELGFYQARK